MALATNYQQFIHVLQYARFTGPGRESWPETVKRTSDFLFSKVPLAVELRKEIHDAILNCEIMPSMRVMMSAGPALERENICAYNCSYLPIDSLNSFVELLYILMCQAGVGFSVEQKYIDLLPSVPSQIYSNGQCYDMVDGKLTVRTIPYDGTGGHHTIVIADSREGWALGYREFITELFKGRLHQIDYSLIRPEGSRLRTTGGRASGPEPLKRLVKYTTDLVLSHLGQRLTAADVHCLCCMEGQCVVAGGVRRSATISLSDLDNMEMREIKSGKWYLDKPYLTIANNSAVYHGKPSREVFDREWKALEESHSGERGIFNRVAAEAQACRYGRREHGIEYGVNPCCEIILRPRQFCNLTEVIIRPNDNLVTLSRKVRLATILGTIQSTLTKFNENIVSPDWRINCDQERLLGVSFTGIMDNPLMAKVTPQLELTLDQLHQEAVQTNAKYAKMWNINPSAAITTVKPAGTTSQLTDTSSGIHPRYGHTYLRRVRLDRTDPILSLIRNEYVTYDVTYGPWHTDHTDIIITSNTLNTNFIGKMWDFSSLLLERNFNFVYNPTIGELQCRVPKVNGQEQVTELIYQHLDGIKIEHDRNERELILGFPVNAENTVTRDQVSAIDQLELWKVYNNHWCEHKPSITVYVRDNEWKTVGDWVYNNFDAISGLAFLPYDGGVYEQAPYSIITKNLYNHIVVTTPVIDWNLLSKYEKEDNRSLELSPACSASGGCEA